MDDKERRPSRRKVHRNYKDVLISCAYKEVSMPRCHGRQRAAAFKEEGTSIVVVPDNLPTFATSLWVAVVVPDNLPAFATSMWVALVIPDNLPAFATSLWVAVVVPDNLPAFATSLWVAVVVPDNLPAFATSLWVKIIFEKFELSLIMLSNTVIHIFVFIP